MKAERLLTLFLTAVSIVSLCACGNSGIPEKTTEAPTEKATEKTTEAASETEAPTEKETEAPVVEKKDIYEILNGNNGVTINDISAVTDESIKAMKENNVTFVRIPFMYPWQTDAISLTSYHIRAKQAAKKFKAAGFVVLGQSFWPGGMGYDAASGKRVWKSNIPEVYSDFDDPYFYKIARQACKFLAKDLKDYVDIWLVSNEPDIETYTGAQNPYQICAYLVSCAEGLKEGNPNALCGINLLGQVNEAYSLSFVKALYGENSVFDWLGLDGYYGTLQQGGPETWDAYLTKFHAAAPDYPIIITEWSYSSAEKDPKNTCRFQWGSHVRGPESQAEYVKAGLDVFAKHPEVIGTLWYAIADQSTVCWECGDPECTLYSSWGLFDVNGNAKLSLKAFGEYNKK